MKLEELEEQLRGILQRTEEIKKEIETLKNQDKPVTFIPKDMQKYYYPYCNSKSGFYVPQRGYGNGKYQADAFETEEQCKKACDVLNKIMPVLKYAIENKNDTNYEVEFYQENKMTFEIFFADREKYTNARKLAGETNE